MIKLVIDDKEIELSKESEETIRRELKVGKKLPETYEELGETSGWYIFNGQVCEDSEIFIYTTKDAWPSKKEAEAALALAQLLQLRDRYNDGEKADWSSTKYKYTIFYSYGMMSKGKIQNDSRPLWFKSENLRDKFIKHFTSLIEIAKPLL